MTYNLALLSHKLHTYTDIHRFASQLGLRSVGVLGAVAKCAAQHASHLNIRLLSVMLYSKCRIITYGINILQLINNNFDNENLRKDLFKLKFFQILLKYIYLKT